MSKQSLDSAAGSAHRSGHTRRLTAGIAAATLALPFAIFAGSGVASAADAVAKPQTHVALVDRGWPYPYPYPSPYPVSPYDSSPPTSAIESTDASPNQSTGMVMVSSVIDFGTGEASGTGMVIDPSGIVVTNHHVVEGATSIRVTDASTGTTYVARLLGANATKDVAVLRLVAASDLTTVTTDTSALAAGDTVTAVGDAGGDGGSLSAASGTVTALRRTITVQGDNGTSETLHRLIEVDADIIAGDSGGALLDADGDVVAMNVAASSGTADIQGYAIPIARVLAVADAVLAGHSGKGTELGYDGFLGVTLAASAGPPSIAGVIANQPAEAAGLTAGSTVEAVDGQLVTSAAQLARILARHSARSTVSIIWTDTSGATHTSAVTLARAPIA